MNERIQASEVRLIDAKGEQLGLVSLEDAQARASRDELDLVEVAPEAKPPVCKIMDYRRHTFEVKRRLKESRKKTRNLDLKEVKLRPNIDPHDYAIKMRRARVFLEKGHKVKVTMRYRPRELRHIEIGSGVLDKMAEEVADIATAEKSQRGIRTSRIQTMILTVSKKKKALDMSKKESAAERDGS